MGNAESAPAGRVHWHPSATSGPCCWVVRIQHPPGLPVGAAALLGQWIQHGTQLYPHRTGLQRALEQAGAQLQCSVEPASTTLAVVAADWDWSATLLLELLQRPLLETETFEELDMMQRETKKPFSDWVARHWGWSDPAPVQTAAQLRGVWRYLYAPAHMAIAVSGHLPTGSQDLLQRLSRPPTLTHEAVKWTPPAAAAPALPVNPTVRGAPGIRLLFSFPPLSRRQRDLIQVLWGQHLQEQCRQCRSWATACSLHWHVLGERVHVLDVALTTPRGIHLSGEQLAAEATQRLQQFSPTPDAQAAAHRTLAARRQVAQGTLLKHTLQYLEAPHQSSDVVALCRAHLREPCTVRHDAGTQS